MALLLTYVLWKEVCLSLDDSFANDRKWLVQESNISVSCIVDVNNNKACWFVTSCFG